VSKPIYHITPFTLIDYPDKTACIIWFAGCNMRCRYCYNVDIVRGKGNLEYDDALKFLMSRKGLLDGVVLSGGECTLHQNLESFIHDLRELGFLIKIDTNGSSPNRLHSLISQQLVDYVALDFKALQAYFYRITQSDLFKKFERSLDLLLQSSVKFEVRTTIHSQLFDQIMIEEMIQFLEKKKYNGPYYLQNYFNHSETLEDIGNDFQKINMGDYRSGQFEVMVRN
jgi:pyruvate formate lyase activating enzyme